ncbi:two-component system response regulator QseB [Fluviicoccus keumensis]|uniref:Two-component system response regulator QseB n=1 Tax=Fluviicoccus keumensis TaxID=1435465 RepID=A0A4V6MFQ6_9GAMM|nr:response regulator [Fluviicoccus keumensis]RZU37046.1 two-component system response regulator QseB [Fluviicoccus keumensis]
MRILLAEDDILLGEGLQEALALQGYVVEWYKDGVSTLHALEASDFDLLLLDLGLPRMDGMEVLARIRARQTPLPVLILTARDALDARVAGLDAGADDYLLKPFDLAELMARVRALTRRASGRPSNQLSIGRIVLDTGNHQVLCDGSPVVLSRREFLLLKELCMHAGHILSKSQLEESLYGWSEEVESNALEVHIHHLRKKLYPELIKTVRGVGYMVEGGPQP